MKLLNILLSLLLTVMPAASQTIYNCAGTIVSPNAGTISCTPVPLPIQPPPQAAGYQLVFSDTFNPLNLGTTWFNPGVWWEVAAPSTNITQSASGLGLVWSNGQKPPNDTSIATSSPKGIPAKAWTFGYIEVSMKFTPATGAWPGIWMMPTAGITNPSGEHGEIDLFEWQSQSPTTFYGTIHDWVGSTDKQNNNSSNAHPLPAGTNLAQYHTYGLLWTATSISWYFDNVLMGTSPTFPILSSQSYYLILENQVGSNWVSGNSGNLSSQTMNVQWVHVFQQ